MDDKNFNKDIINKSLIFCRTCMKEKANFQIFSNKKQDIINAIKVIANLEVSENDGLSKFICAICVSTLQRSMKFRLTAQESDIVQRKQLVKLETNECELNNEDSIHDEEYPDNLKDKETNPPNKSNFKKEPDPIINQGNNSTKQSRKTKQIFLKIKRSKTEKIECEICKKEVTKYYYQQHLTLHGQGTPKQKNKVECTICKKSLEKSYLKDHLLSVHGENKSKFICDTCGKTYRFRSGYKNHILSHTNEFPFKCDLCPYKGRHLELLKTHMRTHTRDYKYKCTECSSSFLTSGNLNKHKLKHKEKTLKCKQCPRMFHLKGDLEKHLQVEHMGVKNHVCEICHKAFGYRSTMMKHQYLIHDREKNVSGRTPAYLEIEKQERMSENKLSNQRTELLT